jgi:hypothetical protein
VNTTPGNTNVLLNDGLASLAADECGAGGMLTPGSLSWGHSPAYQPLEIPDEFRHTAHLLADRRCGRTEGLESAIGE